MEAGPWDRETEGQAGVEPQTDGVAGSVGRGGLPAPLEAPLEKPELMPLSEGQLNSVEPELMDLQVHMESTLQNIDMKTCI